MPKKISTAARAKSRYNNDCSVKGVASNFMKIRKDASVAKPITTGSKVGDFIITKNPYVGKGIQAINIPPQVGDHIAHGVNAYRESCNNRKKK